MESSEGTQEIFPNVDLKGLKGGSKEGNSGERNKQLPDFLEEQGVSPYSVLSLKHRTLGERQHCLGR